MRQYNDVFNQSNCQGLRFHRRKRCSRSLPFRVMLVVLALTTLACVCVGARAPRHVVIHNRLPPLTATPLPTLTPTVISSSQIAPEATIAPSTPTPILLPTVTPASNNPAAVTSSSGQNAGGAILTSLVGLNVRSGPGMGYPVIGQLAQSQSAQIVGKNPEGTWWQIVYPSNSSGRAWVSANAQYSSANNTNAIQIAQLPPPPIATPTVVAIVQLPPTLVGSGEPVVQSTQIAVSIESDAQIPETPALPSSPTVGPPTPPISTSSDWDFTNVRVYADQDEDGLLLYGNVTNNTGTAQELTGITGTFYNDQGQIVADREKVQEYWPFVEIIPQGSYVSFELTVEGIQNAAKFDLAIEAEPSDESPRQDFEFLDLKQSNEDNYCLTGRLRNPGGELEASLTTVAVLYDEQDHVINFADYYHPFVDELIGGQTLDFEICVDPLNQPVARHELLAWGF